MSGEVGWGTENNERKTSECRERVPRWKRKAVCWAMTTTLPSSSHTSGSRFILLEDVAVAPDVRCGSWFGRSVTVASDIIIGSRVVLSPEKHEYEYRAKQ